MAREYSQVNFRIPTKLKEKIEESASTNDRSITAELVARLEQSFEPEIQVHETLEFKLMMQSYLDQAQQIKELRTMLEQLLKKG